MNNNEIADEVKLIQALQKEYIYKMVNRSNFICLKTSGGSPNPIYHECLSKLMNSSIYGLEVLNKYFSTKY
jgi:hypothetical protein